MMRGISTAAGGKNSHSRHHDSSDNASIHLRPAVVVILTIWFGLSLALPLSLVALADDPDANTFFEYDYFQKVDSGSGAYSGYDEETNGKGRYEVVSWGPDEVDMIYSYGWDYWNDEGLRLSGGRSGNFSFSLSTRLYTSPTIDLDDPEYEALPANTLGQWVWISPDVEVGDRIHILDDNWTVTDKDKTLWSKWVSKKVIEVEVKGYWSRNDDYGVFDFSYTDRLYFEKQSGMFVAERYEEWDSGFWQGDAARFRYVVEMDVTESSYEVEIDWFTLITKYTCDSLLIAFLVGGFIYLIYRGRWMRRNFTIKDIQEFGGSTKPGSGVTVKFRRVWKMTDYPHRENNATDYFGPFLEHWAEKALLAKDRVSVATTRLHGLVGFGLYNKEAKIGTILCKNTQMTETLRSFTGSKDFFTESRHIVKPDKWMKKNSTLMAQMRKTKNEAYNIFETHTVYELPVMKPIVYDTNLVRPMTARDLRKVASLARKIYRSKARRWIKACYNSGDLSYVATLNGTIVGFGFACVSGEYGRLHTLGVAKEHRGKGIGKELHLARLNAMQLMGVTRVIDEIADWNLASIRISTLSGFKPIGKMYVETVRTKRIKKNIIRR
jgi:GNAT superfamily N-acetyltransferase